MRSYIIIIYIIIIYIITTYSKMNIQKDKILLNLIKISNPPSFQFIFCKGYNILLINKVQLIY